ncbi:hypothetical protein ACIHEJ_39485 [Streptomyces sp. NPDC052301]|uniref:hypothetical protein n=1 Tax=Streptomyces sp. NPDC052301 TaxID=3365687 RepID=UPI0037D508A0
MQGIPPLRSRRGPRRRRPAKLHADKDYDDPHLRRWLRTRGIIPRIAVPRHRELHTPGPTPLGRRTHHRLAHRLPPPAPSLRAQARPLPGLHRAGSLPHLLPQTPQMKWLL